MSVRCSHQARNASISEIAERDVIQRPGRAGKAPGGEHEAEPPGGGVEGDVVSRIGPELRQAEGALVPRHAGIEVRHLQLEVGQSVDRRRIHPSNVWVDHGTGNPHPWHHQDRRTSWQRPPRTAQAGVKIAWMATSTTRLVLICGLPASGKSTLARQLAAQFPAVRLDKDEWVTQLGADVWDDEFRVRLERQLWALTQTLLALGQSVILEWGHWGRAERDEKRLGARALGVGVELHYLDVALEVLIERAERRTVSGEWTASPMTRAHFETWSTIFQPPDSAEILLFDEPVAD